MPPFVQDPYRAIPAPKGVYRPVGTWMRGRIRGGHFDLETRNPIRPKKFGTSPLPISQETGNTRITKFSQRQFTAFVTYILLSEQVRRRHWCIRLSCLMTSFHTSWYNGSERSCASCQASWTRCGQTTSTWTYSQSSAGRMSQ